MSISSPSVIHLINMGLSTKRVDINGGRVARALHRRVRVTSVEDKDEYADTYCFNEPLKHRGVFNGILTSQCSEIIQKTDKDEIAVCNLASMALPTYVSVKTSMSSDVSVKSLDTQPSTFEMSSLASALPSAVTSSQPSASFDFDLLHKNVKIVTKNLNKIIDNNFYPLEKTARSNFRHRPIGIGIQGLADVFALMKLNFDSPEAARLNAMIFETMYHAALEASMEIAKKRADLVSELASTSETRKAEIFFHLNLKDCEKEQLDGKWPGAYSSFAGSPASEGQLQFDLWNTKPHTDRYDWDALKADIKTYGLRNSLLLAPMPTASTSQIMGYNEAFESFTSNLYKRKTLAGEFIVANKYMMTDLMELGLWNQDLKDALMVHEGSIQNIPAIPQEIRDRYKTVWEIKQKVVIDMAADRGRYVCQSQSMNLFMEDPDFKRLSSMHFYAWGKGLKTGMYYLRTKPKAAAQQFTVDPRKANAAGVASAGANKPAIVVTPVSPATAVAGTEAVASPKLKAPAVVVKAEAEEDDDEPEQQAVGCKWKPGCKTCSS